MPVTRFGVSLESELLEALDKYVIDNNFPNRSQAIRQLIERNLVEKKWQCNRMVAGAIILVYERQRRELGNKLSEIREAYAKEILSVQLLQLTPDTSMEITAVRGASYRLTELADKLIGLKGIRHGKLVMTKSDDKPE